MVHSEDAVPSLLSSGDGVLVCHWRDRDSTLRYCNGWSSGRTGQSQLGLQGPRVDGQTEEVLRWSRATVGRSDEGRQTENPVGLQAWPHVAVQAAEREPHVAGLRCCMWLRG